MYVYTTQVFKEKIKHYNLEDRVGKLREALEHAEGPDTVRALFDPIPPYWRRRAEKCRLIGRVRRIDDEQVMCLLDVLSCEEPDYKAFGRDPRKFGEKSLDPLLNDDELHNWLRRSQQLEAETQRQVKRIRSLPPELSSWLKPPGWEIDTYAKDLVIYESEEWIARFRTSEILLYWQTFHDILMDIVLTDLVGEIDKSFQDVISWPGLKLAPKDKCFVLFRRIDSTNEGPRRVLFLLAPFVEESGEQPSPVGIERVLKAVDPVYALPSATIDPSTLQLTLDELAPFANRSYPYYLLEDDRSWLDIEREEGANLSLSAEEERILRSVSNLAPVSSALPVFINGRAGSGKSTMLFYLFADYCFRKWQQKLEGDPLFLTYNQRLLEVAKDRVRRLLSSHHRFLTKRTQGQATPSVDDFLEQIDNFFRPFQRFLLDLLPEEEKVRFSSERYISFHRFKQLYMGKPLRKQEQQVVLMLPQAKRWSPELCWHVIRTFIKGYSLDGYIEPDDYLEVPRRERTIAEDAFRQIYETIWTKWYELITTQQGYWDDQDLVRAVLERSGDLAKYAAVICDEAQDFTRLELHLLMRLSVFSQYDLGRQPVQSLPFAFAGDPFQTLNPTGFRWSSIRATFYDEVIRPLDPDGRMNLGMNSQELAYNYRSTPPIVRVTNLIQLCRHVLFDLPELEPQISWKKGDFPEPLKFILGQDIQPAQLYDKVEHTIIIVPCEGGQEASYIKEDDTLSQIFPNAERDLPKNVFSPIGIKGLEFKRVILYKFGHACPERLWELLTQPTEHLEFEYFFNKLYVAATRAMERLFVVDSNEGDQRLWSYVCSSENLQEILNKAKKPQSWRPSIQRLSTGTAASLSEMREEELESNARELREKGSSQEEPDLLRRASKYYTTVGKTREAELCEAEALELEEEYREAGELFRKHGEVDQARACFWKGECWRELEMLGSD